jgi:hypothetical protein
MRFGFHFFSLIEHMQSLSGDAAIWAQTGPGPGNSIIKKSPGEGPKDLADVLSFFEFSPLAGWAVSGPDTVSMVDDLVRRPKAQLVAGVRCVAAQRVGTRCSSWVTRPGSGSDKTTCPTWGHARDFQGPPARAFTPASR